MLITTQPFPDNQCTILSFTKCYRVNKMVVNRWRLLHAQTGGQNYRNTLVTKWPHVETVQQLGELCVLNHCLDINKQVGLLLLKQWWKLITMGQELKDEGTKTSQGDSGCYKTNPFNSPGRWRVLRFTASDLSYKVESRVVKWSCTFTSGSRAVGKQAEQDPQCIKDVKYRSLIGDSLQTQRRPSQESRQPCLSVSGVCLLTGEWKWRNCCLMQRWQNCCVDVCLTD